MLRYCQFYLKLFFYNFFIFHPSSPFNYFFRPFSIFSFRLIKIFVCFFLLSFLSLCLFRLPFFILFNRIFSPFSSTFLSFLVPFFSSRWSSGSLRCFCVYFLLSLSFSLPPSLAFLFRLTYFLLYFFI